MEWVGEAENLGIYFCFQKVLAWGRWMEGLEEEKDNGKEVDMIARVSRL